MNLFTRRQAASAGLGFLAAGTAPAAVPNLLGPAAPNLRPITNEEASTFSSAHIGFGSITALLLAEAFQKLEPACPGLRELCETRLAELWRDVAARYPNLVGPAAPAIRRYIDAYSGEEGRQRDHKYALSKEAHTKSEHEKSLKLTERERELQAEFEAYNPTQEEIQDRVTTMRGRSQAQLALDLAISRRLWRAHPELVECENFPEPFKSAYLEYEGCDVEEININIDCLSSDFEQRLTAEAEPALRERREDEFRQSLEALAKELGPKEWNWMMAE